MAYLDYAGLQRYHGKIEDNFAKIDGAYEGMTVGNAEELVTGLEEEESVPFIFRTSGGQLEIGSREDLTVVGGSLAWNQNARPFETEYWQGESGVTVTYADGVATISSETAGNGARTKSGYGYAVIKGHKYFASIDAKCSTTLQNLVFGSPSSTGVYFTKPNFSSTSYVTISGIKNCTNSLNNHFFAYGTGVTYTDLMVKNFIFIDLTQLFGSTIADYIYSLEQNTAGAGVAFFKKLFPKSYYPYNAGELLSVNASAFKTVGFNQWDEEWELGNISAVDGTNSEATNRGRSKNYIPIVPGTNYYFTQPSTMYIYYYDVNKGFISYTSISASTSKTMPSNAYFIRFAMSIAYGTTYKNDICISIHWDNTRDGEYEPYVEHSYALDSDLTLRGVPQLDADNNLYYDGDTYEADGTVTRKYGIVDLGTLTWARWGEYAGMFTAELDNLKQPSTTSERRTGILCSKYSTTENISLNENWTDKSVGRYLSKIVVKDTSYSDLASFQTAMSGVYLVYELATPTTETADTFQKPQIVDNWGTEEFTVTEQSGVAVPVGHNTIYPISLRDKLEAMPNLPSEDGDYILRMRSGEPAYIALANEFPAPPTTDGTYTLKATVSSGAATLTWEEVNA